MNQWHEFLKMEHSGEILIAIGGMFLFAAFFQIARHSMKLFFWVIIACLGIVATTYGFKRSPYDIPSLGIVERVNLANLTPGLDSDVLDFLCNKLDDYNTDLQ